MASHTVARRPESASLSPVNEEGNDSNDVMTSSQDRGKQPALPVDERTPLFSSSEREAMRRDMSDDDSSYDTVPLPDMTYSQVMSFAWAPCPDDPHWNPRYPYKPNVRAFLVGAAGWIVAYACRGPLYFIVTFGGRWASLTSVLLASFLSVGAQELLRLGVLMLLNIHLHTWYGHPEWIPHPVPQDRAFRDVWWVAMGWMTSEATLSVFQGYDQLSLYKELFDARDQDEERLKDNNANGHYGSVAHRSVPSGTPDDDIKRGTTVSPPNASSYEEEFAQSIQFRDREALELVYGVPLPNIPVFISCLQRVDAQILSLGLTLLVSIAYVSTDRPLEIRALIFGLVVLLHSLLTVVWAELLPRVGIHIVSYASLLVALGTFFGGLALWGALE
ncbi:hypothetical protein BN14_01094 [Rhizoctonia solani AG-1 IB]|uniref:Uncharacterized protein n=1 Tax=Thanatephorus cucumeris (strain AG1-IB / isolate 7/3/14) TaxID=1108050 RepID=M5BLI6_THACB|nr:hypothetical protein BN14_01094 [Rhizoctonia solani AG-1 IB]